MGTDTAAATPRYIAPDPLASVGLTFRMDAFRSAKRYAIARAMRADVRSLDRAADGDLPPDKRIRI